MNALNVLFKKLTSGASIKGIFFINHSMRSYMGIVHDVVDRISS